MPPDAPRAVDLLVARDEPAELLDGLHQHVRLSVPGLGREFGHARRFERFGQRRQVSENPRFEIPASDADQSVATRFADQRDEPRLYGLTVGRVLVAEHDEG